jgi:hypothetical protein
LLYLKHRYGLGYESLCREVSDSLGWPPVLPHRPGPAGAAPDHLVKLVRRAGPGVVEQLNAALVAKAAQGKLLRARVAGYLAGLAEFQEARVHFERALAIDEARLGADHPDTGSSRKLLAELRAELGEA